MRLILVRHGRPDEEDAVSPHDPPLNADGRRQAQMVKRFQDVPRDAERVIFFPRAAGGR